MYNFDHIAIIFNPHSSGNAHQKAKELQQDVEKYQPEIGVSATLVPTKHQAHAIELTKAIALQYTRPLIISVSGDGGYNEVVNGAMEAKEQNRSAKPVVAVVAAGNANDHRRVMRDEPLIQLIRESRIRPLDLLLLDAKAKDYRLHRYAHSYIGFGITPQVGNEINKHGKSLFKELLTILRTYRVYAPFKIRRGSEITLLDNLVFANINEMAKVIKLDDENTPRDGKFEVISLPHRSRLDMLKTLLYAALKGFSNPPSYTEYSLKTIDQLPLQLDGEIEQLPPNSDVIVSSSYQAIESLY